MDNQFVCKEFGEAIIVQGNSKRVEVLDEPVQIIVLDFSEDW
jgi:hypothetical protein